MTWTRDTALWLEASLPLRLLGPCYGTCHVNAAPAGGSLYLFSGLSSSFSQGGAWEASSGPFYSQEEAPGGQGTHECTESCTQRPHLSGLEGPGWQAWGVQVGWRGQEWAVPSRHMPQHNQVDCLPPAPWTSFAWRGVALHP